MFKFDFPSLIIFAGSSKSGKTYAIKSIIINNAFPKSKSSFNFGLVFTSTKFNSDYTSFLPNESVIEGFNIDLLNNFKEEIKNKYEDVIQRNIKKGRHPNYGVPASFIVLDDIVSLIKQKDKSFQNFISTFRHYNISVFISVQYIHQIVPIIRQQADYAVIYYHDQAISIKALNESFGSGFENEREFKKFLHEKTKNRFNCIIYQKHDYDNKYIVWKAPSDVPKVMFKF